MDIEKRNDIVFGMFNLGQDVDDMAIGSFDYIKKDIMDIKTSYIRLGFHLAECKTCKYYEKFGYVDFHEFVFNNFGLDKSALSRILAVYDRFCMRNNNGNRTMFLDDKYVGYSYSQLCEMLPLSNKEIYGINSNMTVSQIREYKKSLKTGNNEVVNSCDVATVEKKFEYNKYINLSGAAAASYIKSCSALDMVPVSLFDENGKRLEGSNLWYDVIYREKGDTPRLYLRLCK